MEYVMAEVTDGALDDLRGGLEVIVGRLGDIIQAIRGGKTHLTAFAEEL
jgi:hypothetical protein